MRRILVVLAAAGTTLGGMAFAQQFPPGSSQSGSETVPAPTDQQPAVNPAPPTDQQPAVNPAPATPDQQTTEPEPGSSMSGQETTPPEAAPAPDTATPAPPPAPIDTTPYAESAPAETTHEDHGKKGVGLTVTGEAGIQAFSGSLSHSLRAGPAWGFDALIRPHIPVGLELRYQGASNQLFGSGNFWNGPREARVLQNGAQAMVHVPLAPDRSRIQPFVAGGVGISWYTLNESVPGYQNDSVGQVPVGAGVNFQLRPADKAGALTLGVRGDYDVLFSNQFAPTNTVTDYGIFTKQGGDQYRGELTLGGSF